MAHISNNIVTLLFADDSNLFIENKNLINLQQQVNSELPKLVEWLCTNRLSLNIKKTHLMIFRPKKTKDIPNIVIKIDNQILEIVKNTKFLGVIIDNGLTWKDHALMISKKIVKTIGILSLARRNLNQKTVIQLYYSFVYPYLNYCNLAWGNAPDTLWSIYRNQKIAIRIIANIPRISSSIAFCKTHKILRLPEIYTQAAGLFMYKYKSGLLPAIFTNFFYEEY